MSGFPPEQTFTAPDPPAGTSSGPPRWSGVAVTAFVLSFLLAPVGLLLGIFGIFHTRGGRRRGMGLSIAAIPIGCVVSILLAVVGWGVYVGIDAFRVARSTTSLFVGSSAGVSQRAEEIYARMSPRFKVTVSGDRFEEWAAQVLVKHGSLQRVKKAARSIAPSPDRQGLTFNLTGEFVNGPANIAVTVGFLGTNAEVDDISVDGRSPRSPN